MRKAHKIMLQRRKKNRLNSALRAAYIRPFQEVERKVYCTKVVCEARCSMSVYH
jgi:hypothetical protein